MKNDLNWRFIDFGAKFWSNNTSSNTLIHRSKIIDVYRYLLKILIRAYVANTSQVSLNVRRFIHDGGLPFIKSYDYVLNSTDRRATIVIPCTPTRAASVASDMSQWENVSSFSSIYGVAALHPWVSKKEFSGVSCCVKMLDYLPMERTVRWKSGFSAVYSCIQWVFSWSILGKRVVFATLILDPPVCVWHWGVWVCFHSLTLFSSSS